MAYNSRHSQLTDDELLALNSFCIRTVKDLDPDNIVVVGDPIHGSTRNSIKFAQHAKDEGGDLISLIMREKYFCDEQVIEHYAEIGRATNFPILVHEMPFLSGFNGTQIHWPQSLFPKLKQVPQIAALKEDAKDFDITCTALALEPEIKVIIAGVKRELLRYKPHGADGYLNGISIIDAAIGETFWRAWKADDAETMRFVIEDLERPFFDGVVSRYGWHRCNKALLQAAGLMHRRERMPLPALDEAAFAEVEAVYETVKTAWEEFKASGRAA